MKTYVQLRESTKAAYLRRHDTVLTRLHLANPWGHLADENAFNRVHAACAFVGGGDPGGLAEGHGEVTVQRLNR